MGAVRSVTTSLSKTMQERLGLNSPDLAKEQASWQLLQLRQSSARTAKWPLARTRAPFAPEAFDAPFIAVLFPVRCLLGQ